jgi:hypothetical protein
VPNRISGRFPNRSLTPLAVPLGLVLCSIARPNDDLDPCPPWTRDAVDTLARHALLQGYPAGPFSGPPTLTRPEAAMLTVRAVQGVAS